MQLTHAEKTRLLLYKTAKGNPQGIVVALDEIKRLAAQALEGTLGSAEAKALRLLEQKITDIEAQYVQELNQATQTVYTFIERAERHIASLKPQKGQDGHTPTEAELLMLIEPLIPFVRDGEDGKTPGRDALLELVRPLIQAEILNQQPSVGAVVEAERDMDDLLEAKIKNAIADKISEIKRFGGGGATGANPTPIRNITVHGTGDRKLTKISSTRYQLPRTPKNNSQQVYLNGIRQDEGASNDYTMSNRFIDFNIETTDDDKVVVDIEAGY